MPEGDDRRGAGHEAKVERRHAAATAAIGAKEPRLRSMTDEELRAHTEALRTAALADRKARAAR